MIHDNDDNNGDSGSGSKSNCRKMGGISCVLCEHTCVHSRRSTSSGRETNLNLGVRVAPSLEQKQDTLPHLFRMVEALGFWQLN